MEYLLQFRKFCHIEKRRWLLVVGLVAITHLLCQSLLLPYGNALLSLLPGDEIQIGDKGSFSSRSSSIESVMVGNSILVKASDSVGATLFVGMVKNADKYNLGGEMGQRMGVNRSAENNFTLSRKDLENNDEHVEDRKGDDDFPSENFVDVDQNSVIDNIQDYNSLSEKANKNRHSLLLNQIVEPSNGTSPENILQADTNVMPEKVGTTRTAVPSLSVALPQEENNPGHVTDRNADDNFPSEKSQSNQDFNSLSEKGNETEHILSLEQIVEPNDGNSAENVLEADTAMMLEKVETIRTPVPSHPVALAPVDPLINISSSETLVSNVSSVVGSPALNRSSAGAEMRGLSKDESHVQLQSDLAMLKNNDAIMDKTPTKKMKSEMPPKSIMSIDEMNQLLVRHRRSSRAMRPRWSSVRDQEILAAKLQIENAPIVKNDGELYAPLFRNVSRFKRSYELMERTLKIYIYKEGEKPIFHRPILKGLYASEGWFMKLMEVSKQFVVKDPRKAHLFYMPFSSRMLEYTLYVRNSHNRTNLRQYLKQYTEKIAAKYRFWNRTGGADHFLVACHDWAPYETRHHMEHCIKALCNADITAGFKIGRDVSLPETYVRSARNPLRDLGGKPPSKRHILAFYAGNIHGYLRPILLRYWKDKDPEMKIFGPMPPGVASKMNYIQHMKSSKYCICPKGYEVNSPRVVEAIFYECVPVIISDNFVPPFFDVLDWGAFSLILAEKDIPNLKDILLSIPEEKYLDMQLAVRKVQKHFLWHAKPLKYDLFHMTLHSIWHNRVFQIKLR